MASRSPAAPRRRSPRWRGATGSRQSHRPEADGNSPNQRRCPRPVSGSSLATAHEIDLSQWPTHLGAAGDQPCAARRRGRGRQLRPVHDPRRMHAFGIAGRMRGAGAGCPETARWRERQTALGSQNGRSPRDGFLSSSRPALALGQVTVDAGSRHYRLNRRRNQRVAGNSGDHRETQK